jgi:hypothetical protein
LIVAPALPQQIWGMTARVLSLGGLPPGDLLVTGFAFGQVAAYALLSLAVLLVFRNLLLLVLNKWIWLFGLVVLTTLLTFSSAFSLVTSGFANYSWASAGVLIAFTGALRLNKGSLALPIAMLLCGGFVAAMSYAATTPVVLGLALWAGWRLRARNVGPINVGYLTAISAAVGTSFLVFLVGISIFRSIVAGVKGMFILVDIYFFPLEALLVTGGIVGIPLLAMMVIFFGAISYLSFVSSRQDHDATFVSFLFISLIVVPIVLVLIYSLVQIGDISYYAKKFQHLLLVALFPFFAFFLMTCLRSLRRSIGFSVSFVLLTLIFTTQGFGYSLPFGQNSYLASGWYPSFISPALGWVQLVDNPKDFQGFPGQLVAKAGIQKSEGAVLIWNPIGLEPTQERGLQLYVNSMHYRGDAWVWSIANSWLGTQWQDFALDQLWNWRWTNWRRPVTIYVPSETEAARVEARLSEFVAKPEGGIAECVSKGTCLTRVQVLR